MADQSIMARAGAALRYAVTGKAPTDWFGPGEPLAAQAPADVKGRGYDYLFAANWNFIPRGTEPMSFIKLKRLADGLDPLRMVIERQKDLIEAQDFDIVGRNAKKDETPSGVAEIKTFLERPDQEQDWAQWIRAVLEQLYVLDAVSIYGRPTRAGDLFSLDILDGATITPLLNQAGRRPVAPFPAYQQVIKSMPAVDYTTEELLYYPQNYRVDRRYGYSRVEHVVNTIETAIARAKSQLGAFTHGNLSDGFFTAPADWNADQILAFGERWDAMMLATIEGKRRAPWAPSGTKFERITVDPFSGEFDEWLIRLICFGFGVSPTPFLKQMGISRGSAETDQDAAEAGGIKPTMKYVARLMNRIIATWFGRPDLQFKWIEDQEYDPKTQAEIDDKKLKNGTRLRNEIRARDGEQPIKGGDRAYVELGGKLVAVEDLEEFAAIPEAGEVPGADALAAPGAPNPKPGVKAAPAAAEQPDDEEDDDKLAKAADLDAKRRAASETSLQLVIARFLDAQAKIIAPQLAESLGVQKAATDEGYEGRIDAALDDVDWAWQPLADKVERIIVGIATAAGKKAVSTLGLFDADTLALMSANATAWAKARAAELVGMRIVEGVAVENPSAAWSIPRATRNMLRSIIAQSMEDGASTDTLAKAIREATAFSKERAVTIARTEAAKADVNGNIEGWRATGLVAGKQFAASPDCCEECADYDGEIVSIDDDFSFGPDLPHPKCRCDVVAVLPEDMPDAAED